MKNIDLRPFGGDTELTDYMPVPRRVLELGLCSTAVLIYAALLDRATLSRKNRYMEEGQVYVLYGEEALAERFSISDRAVRTHLRTLEKGGLIRRVKVKKAAHNRIFLRLPADSILGTKVPDKGQKTSDMTGRKVPPNNKNKQQEYINYYQHSEDESL